MPHDCARSSVIFFCQMRHSSSQKVILYLSNLEGFNETRYLLVYAYDIYLIFVLYEKSVVDWVA